jgi:tRNA wybutosine-synthesizing protein 2
MAFKSKMAKLTGIKESLLPSSYQMVGDIMLLKLPRLRDGKKSLLAESVLKEFPYVKTVCEISGVTGELREPVTTKLAGKDTVTIHKENGLLYRINVSQVMFSKGNLNERKRLIEKIRHDEQIVDMFAGIGYFSLGLAKFSPARNIIAIEKNPNAYNLFVENIALNKITNISAIQGDCRIAAQSMQNAADRVLMGYFPGTEHFLPAAIFMVKNKGMIHFHNIYSKKELWSKPLADLETICRGMNCSFRIMEKKKVKSYAPNVFHAVMDVEIEKA